MRGPTIEDTPLAVDLGLLYVAVFYGGVVVFHKHLLKILKTPNDTICELDDI